MRSMTVYCSASEGIDPIFKPAARRTGEVLAERGIELVYGGGAVGLMGETARACKEAGGRVTGVITKHLLDSEQGWTGCDELLIVDSMRERKQEMIERAEGFLTLPGGLGTYEEFFETLVGRLLMEHQRPIGVLNDQGHFDPLIEMFRHGVEHRFITEPTWKLVHIGSDPEQLIDELCRAQTVEIDPDEFYPARSG